MRATATASGSCARSGSPRSLNTTGNSRRYDTGVEDFCGRSTRHVAVMQLVRGSTLEALLNQADTQRPASVAWAAADRWADSRGARRRAPGRYRAPRHLPGNVMVTDGGLVKCSDAASRSCGRGSAPPADPGRPHGGHPRVHVARADARPGRHRRVDIYSSWLPAP